MLPIRTTVEDIQIVCGYLVKKPTGATTKEAKAVIDSKHLDGRKLSALRKWGFIEDQERLKLTSRGREAVRDHNARQVCVLGEVVQGIAPYRAMVERAAHKKDYTITASDVAAHWHDHFESEVSDNDKILNDQAVCFFQLASGAGLGQLVVGRRGSPTRFDYDNGALELFLDGEPAPSFENAAGEPPENSTRNLDNDLPPDTPTPKNPDLTAMSRRVFITHGKNKSFIDPIKKLLGFGELIPVVSVDKQSVSKPVPDKVMDDMRGCGAAIIHVEAEETLKDKEAKDRIVINPNVLLEIGAAMALFGRRFILLVRSGVTLPSNLQGLYEVRYDGENLDGEATIRLLEAINDIKNHTMPDRS